MCLPTARAHTPPGRPRSPCVRKIGLSRVKSKKMKNKKNKNGERTKSASRLSRRTRISGPLAETVHGGFVPYSSPSRTPSYYYLTFFYFYFIFIIRASLPARVPERNSSGERRRDVVARMRAPCLDECRTVGSRNSSRRVERSVTGLPELGKSSEGQDYPLSVDERLLAGDHLGVCWETCSQYSYRPLGSGSARDLGF